MSLEIIFAKCSLRTLGALCVSAVLSCDSCISWIGLSEPEQNDLRIGANHTKAPQRRRERRECAERIYICHDANPFSKLFNVATVRRALIHGG